MPLAYSTGASIHYLTEPPCERCPKGMPTVLFVHGGGGSAYVWLHQLPFFASNGFYAVALSVRGSGQSRLELEDPELVSSSLLAEDCCCVLDAVGAKRCAIVAHGTGGFYAARLCYERPDRVTHCVMSSTFYGLVDDSDELPFVGRWTSRYAARGGGASDLIKGPSRDDLAITVKDLLDTPEAARASRSELQGRSRWPTPPDDFTQRFRERRPEICFLLDQMSDGNAQVARLGLETRYKVLHVQGAVTPRKLRKKYKGPLMFTATECDSTVHWELVCLVAQQCTGNTSFHVWRGDAKHNVFAEDPDQYNYGLLAFLQDRPRPPPPPRKDDGTPDVFAVIRENVALQKSTLDRINDNLVAPPGAPYQGAVLPGRFLPARAEDRRPMANDDLKAHLARAYASQGQHPTPKDAPYRRDPWLAMVSQTAADDADAAQATVRARVGRRKRRS